MADGEINDFAKEGCKSWSKCDISIYETTCPTHYKYTYFFCCLAHLWDESERTQSVLVVNG